ncbi:hypothetical protein CH63R_07892 [Colletotrichum higginsianum IMI 349063]|uniref:Uncharacterized protein n=1 Tax=Colletotrichum higginsianum (strain IMI 349063) TaxID=759273 RepID=A0A1B7YAU7_COLHI|nr:hypothetical protein CH63R_07892 [Colletotrichum higginsianum IMI 349063]OBR09127.1 hypothetical protein CH63R_07892 [Colletotrichum higginsianum IMI 349063]
MPISLHGYRLVPGMSHYVALCFNLICQPDEDNRIDTFLDNTPNNSDFMSPYPTKEQLKSIGDGCSENQYKQKA